MLSTGDVAMVGDGPVSGYLTCTMQSHLSMLLGVSPKQSLRQMFIWKCDLREKGSENREKGKANTRMLHPVGHPEGLLMLDPSRIL